MTGLKIHRAGPGVTVQDLGRPGHLARGLSRSGAADTMALYEAAALLRQSPGNAVVEMAGTGGQFEVLGTPVTIALTGAEMRCSVNGRALAWHGTHRLEPGEILEIGGAVAGHYGYLAFDGGIQVDMVLGARAAHTVAGIGQALTTLAELPLSPTGRAEDGLMLDVHDRFSGGTLRVVRSMQTSAFAAKDVQRFAETRFVRDARGNRMGVRLTSDGPGFAAEGGLNVLSEVIVTGDIQVTGDGTPFVLLPESQTTGGYPRIATVIPADLPKIAQAPAGAEIRFEFVDMDVAVSAQRGFVAGLEGMAGAVRPRVRDPHTIPDLLSYQLISGAVAGSEGDPE
ncbi:MAG: urea amidolyase [Pseudomonadota bacterium]